MRVVVTWPLIGFNEISTGLFEVDYFDNICRRNQTPSWAALAVLVDFRANFFRQQNKNVGAYHRFFRLVRPGDRGPNKNSKLIKFSGFRGQTDRRTDGRTEYVYSGPS